LAAVNHRLEIAEGIKIYLRPLEFFTIMHIHAKTQPMHTLITTLSYWGTVAADLCFQKFNKLIILNNHFIKA